MVNNAALLTDLIRLQTLLHKHLTGSLSVHGIGVSDFQLLQQLHKAPAHTMRRSDLAEAIGLSPSGVTRMLNPLQKIGLVEKQLNPRDARVSLVKLNETGKRIYCEALIAFEHSADRLLEPLAQQQRMTLAETLSTLLPRR